MSNAPKAICLVLSLDSAEEDCGFVGGPTGGLAFVWNPLLNTSLLPLVADTKGNGGLDEQTVRDVLSDVLPMFDDGLIMFRRKCAELLEEQRQQRYGETCQKKNDNTEQ